MSRPVTAAEAAALLREAEDILILLHQYPDGDTIGSGYALALALRAIGKRARVACTDAIPEKYSYLPKPDGTFTPQFLCTVDVADPKLLGDLKPLGEQADLCIDHHGTNVPYAKARLVDAACGANSMIVRRVIAALGVPLDRDMANCLYTGLATDTGCFKYECTDPAAHRLAAELMEAGAEYARINEIMFDKKSRARMQLEERAFAGMRFFFGGRCAVMAITAAIMTETGATEDDMEGLAPLPRQIEGVTLGVTLREKATGEYKVSFRTGEGGEDAAAIAVRLGGGGHKRAAGCTVPGPAEEAVRLVVDTIREALPEMAKL